MGPAPTPEIHPTERLTPGAGGWAADSPSHLARYFFAAGFAVGARALDAGTGTGYGAAILKEAGARAVTGVDIDPDAVEQARRRYPLDGLDYVVDDCEQLGALQGPFDLICNFENIEHLPHPERFLKAAAGLLADGGVLLCSTPSRELSGHEWQNGKPSNPFHVTEWYRDDFRRLVGTCFADVDLRCQVESYSSLARKEAFLNLKAHLKYLWSQPLLRLGRAAGRLAGREPGWPDIEGLAAPSAADYPVVPFSYADAIGRTMGHFAVCRSPVR